MFFLFVLAGLVALFVLLQGNMGSDGGKPPPPSAKPRRQSKPDKFQSRHKASPARPASGQMSGKCHVIDGDTIIIRGTKIRLAGIDAPELNEPFGQKAKWAMVNICKGQVVTAELNGETSYDRLVGICHLPDGRDIGAELIKQGLAVDWGFFSGGKYRDIEPKGTRYRLRRHPFNK